MANEFKTQATDPVPQHLTTEQEFRENTPDPESRKFSENSIPDDMVEFADRMHGMIEQQMYSLSDGKFLDIVSNPPGQEIEEPDEESRVLRAFDRVQKGRMAELEACAQAVEALRDSGFENAPLDHRQDDYEARNHMMRRLENLAHDIYSDLEEISALYNERMPKWCGIPRTEDVAPIPDYAAAYREIKENEAISAPDEDRVTNLGPTPHADLSHVDMAADALATMRHQESEMSEMMSSGDRPFSSQQITEFAAFRKRMESSIEGFLRDQKTASDRTVESFTKTVAAAVNDKSRELGLSSRLFDSPEHSHNGTAPTNKEGHLDYERVARSTFDHIREYEVMSARIENSEIRQALETVLDNARQSAIRTHDIELDSQNDGAKPPARENDQVKAVASSIKSINVAAKALGQPAPFQFQDFEAAHQKCQHAAAIRDGRAAGRDYSKTPKVESKEPEIESAPAPEKKTPSMSF